MVLTIIVGKSSNLSNYLHKNINNSIVISSREIFLDTNILLKYKKNNINIIFNNFQPATKLNELENTEEYINNSIGITSKVLNFCLIHNININKIIYTSSSSVYGNNIFCSESDELKPMSLHASLKIANEKMIEKYCEDHNINYSITRLFNMYGGDDNFSIISKIIFAVKNGNNITIVNNGNAIRDFIHIDDVVDIYVKLLKKDIKIINVGTGMGSSIKNILDFLKKNDINLETNNIFKDELKISTSNNKLLTDFIDKRTFLKIDDYLSIELNV